MRKIVAGLLMSLDGVVESPNEWGWSQYMNHVRAVRGLGHLDCQQYQRRPDRQL
jgi:hypothetical protein